MTCKVGLAKAWVDIIHYHTRGSDWAKRGVLAHGVKEHELGNRISRLG
jgi:hypothetical protein